MVSAQPEQTLAERATAAAALVSAAITSREQARLSGDPQVGAQAFEPTLQATLTGLLGPDLEISALKVRNLVDALCNMGAIGFEESARLSGLHANALLNSALALMHAQIKQAELA